MQRSLPSGSHEPGLAIYIEIVGILTKGYRKWRSYMKKNDLIGAREAELMQPYYDSAGPFRPRLMKFIGKLDILEVPKGKNSTVYMMFDP